MHGALAGTQGAEREAVGDAPILGGSDCRQNACQQGYNSADAGYIQPAAQPQHPAPISSSDW